MKTSVKKINNPKTFFKFILIEPLIVAMKMFWNSHFKHF